MKKISTFILLLSMIMVTSILHSQPQVSYMIPDIGAPNFATYVEFVSNASATNSFGIDGFYLQNTIVKILPVNNSDTSKIVIGPAMVSWDGRVVSAHIFVKPTVNPNSPIWQNLQQQFVVPLVLSVNGVSSSPQNFYILQPTNFFAANAIPERVLGQGLLGLRSPRGAMIIADANFAPDTYTVSTIDCDPFLLGNQGFLPFTLLCTGRINAVGTILNVSGQNSNGGPGGGGGGGRFCDRGLIGTPCLGDVGGSGFTGGGGGGKNEPGLNTYQNGGVSSGLVNPTAQFGGSSINGTLGGITTGFESSGGGTGHPFGTSGEGCNDGSTCDMIGGFGGGSGNRQNQSGGSGGNVIDGIGFRVSGGKAHGNSQIIPLSGGSGGASGNPQGNFVNWTSSGSGGGGGGAISVHSFELNGLNINANGGNGGASSSGRGGGGSGGNIILGARIAISASNVSIIGGDGEFVGSSGRYRKDGPIASTVNTLTTASSTTGIYTDSTRFVQSRSFTLRGNASGLVEVYIAHPSQPEFTLLSSFNANGDWALPVTLPGTDSTYYFSTTVGNVSPSQDLFLAVPNRTFTQTSWNIIQILPSPVISSISSKLIHFAPPCDTVSKLDTIFIKNIGGADLLISSLQFSGSTRFSVVSPTSVVVAPSDSIRVIIRVFQPNKVFNPTLDQDSLRIVSNDPNYSGGSYAMFYEVVDESFDLSNSGFYDFGNITITQQSATTLTITNNGNSQISITSLSHNFNSFVVTPIAPTTFPVVLNQGQTETFDARFTPQGPNPIVYNDTVRFVVKNAYCSTTVNIPIRGTGVNPVRASLKLPLIQDADPSLKNYRVPLNLTVKNISSVATLTDTLSCRVSFEATMFFPTGITNGTLRSIQRVGNKRIVDFIITGFVIQNQSNVVLTEIVGDILLGQTEVAPILFESVSWKGVSLDSIIPGVLDLSICQAGGQRLLLNSTIISAILHPNPSNSSVVIDFQPREVGEHRISILDLTGKIVGESILLESNLVSSGIPTLQHNFDVSLFSNGVYRIVLQTPTQLFSYPLHIVR